MISIVLVALSVTTQLLQPGGGPPAGARRGPNTTDLHAQAAGRHDTLDAILDLYVRDGLVYYRALKLERGPFERYLASLDVVPALYARWSRPQQIVCWLNAYNALVLKTVIDHYPIRGQAAAYPANSIRQIPGAFEQRRHRVCGRLVSLDEIENAILPEFNDPRLQLALGRGAVGSSRLRSEAFRAERLEAQLQQAVAEFAAIPQYLRLDRIGNRVTVNPIIGWHESEFVAGYAQRHDTFARRSPIERAILALVEPHLLPLERSFLLADEFAITYHEFDWRLNDLTGGRP